MKYPWIDEYLLGKRGVTKDLQPQWNWIRYHVGGKMFAAVLLDDDGKPYYINCKLPPEEGEILRKTYPDIIPGYYSNKKHWNSVRPDGDIPDDVLRGWLDTSYDLVLRSLSKKAREEIVRGGASALFTNVDCVSLYVPTLEEGIAFYEGLLGMRLLWRAEGSCGLAMREGNTELVLCTSKNPMVDFKVESVEEALPRFVAAGGKCEYGPFDIDIGKCAVVSDPWGNRFCILDMTKGTYDTDAQGNVTGVSPKDRL